MSTILLAALIVYFIFFTFFDLNWGAPYYFHPDERNIASAVSQLNFPSNLNPHFFAYGSFPIYTVYFLGLIVNILTQHNFNSIVQFDMAIILGRIISATLTICLAFLIYKVALEISDRKTASVALIFAITSTAFFQFSHFGTFEIWLSFFSLLSTYSFLRFRETKKTIFFIIAACITGFLISLKLSSLVLIIIPIYIISIGLFTQAPKYGGGFNYKITRAKLLEALKLIIIFIFCSTIFYLATSPFNILDNSSFQNSIHYEGDVATGTLPVFYTGEFFRSIPIVFQYEKILPFLINPILTILSVPAFFYSCFLFIKKKNINVGILLITFLSLFLSGSFLFVKWTRYIVPAIPYLYILLAISFIKFFDRFKAKKFYWVLTFVGFFCFLFSFSFIMTSKIEPDTRIAAKEFAIKDIPPNSTILSEVYDLGIIPFNENFHNISLFNFYDLDNGISPSILKKDLDNTNYIILPSQRIYKIRVTNTNRFPNGNRFYSDLFSGKIGFKKIFETPCDIFCKITYMGNPVFNTEETANVFDRPTLYIFKKI